MSASSSPHKKPGEFLFTLQVIFLLVPREVPHQIPHEI
jgi:hypothetical protein